MILILQSNQTEQAQQYKPKHHSQVLRTIQNDLMMMMMMMMMMMLVRNIHVVDVSNR